MNSSIRTSETGNPCGMDIGYPEIQGEKNRLQRIMIALSAVSIIYSMIIAPTAVRKWIKQAITDKTSDKLPYTAEHLRFICGLLLGGVGRLLKNKIRFRKTE